MEHINPNAGGEGSQDGAREGRSTGVVTAGGYDGESRSKEHGTFVGLEMAQQSWHFLLIPDS